MNVTKKSLLPQGFHDHLPPEAIAELKLNREVVNRLTLFGYELVRPALMEFEESLDKDFTSDFFKVTDTISGKMMVIRNDITPQIARIVRDRFGQTATEKVVRLAYTGQVVRKKGSGRFTERQLTQTGFELVSEDSAQRDAEVLYVALETCERAGQGDITVDLVFPRLSALMLKEAGLEGKELSNALARIEEKDMQSLNADARLAKIVKVMEISDNASDIKTAREALAKLKQIAANKEAEEIFTRIDKVLEILSADVPALKLSLNLLEVGGFAYQKGLCFSFISRRSYDEIGRGGRYKIGLPDGSQLSASGFTFLINSMLRTTNLETKTEQKKTGYKEGFAATAALRDKGTATIFE